MTTSNWKKVFVQLKVKPIILKKYIKHNSPRKRSNGRTLHACERCGSHGGFIGKYRLNLCRHCFRDIAPHIGFKKIQLGEQNVKRSTCKRAVNGQYL